MSTDVRVNCCLWNCRAEELRTAVLLRSVTGQLKVWLQLQIDGRYGYDKVRELILSYERRTARWTEQMVLGSSMTSTDTGGPMEVDRIQKGKGDGKAQQKGNGKKGDGKGTYGGKGKSKFDQKGKGKFSYGDKGKGKGKHSKSGDFKLKGSWEVARLFQRKGSRPKQRAW